jgi:hypothetical protein
MITRPIKEMAPLVGFDIDPVEVLLDTAAVVAFCGAESPSIPGWADDREARSWFELAAARLDDLVVLDDDDGGLLLAGPGGERHVCADCSNALAGGWLAARCATVWDDESDPDVNTSRRIAALLDLLAAAGEWRLRAVVLGVLQTFGRMLAELD